MNHAQFKLLKPVFLLGMAFIILSAFSLCQNAKTATIVQKHQLKVEADDIIGVWHPKDSDYKIELFKSDSEYHGKIIWLKEPNNSKGEPKKDKLNPQRSLRTQPILGMVNITEFEFNDIDDIWEDGLIYDPMTGETMKGTINLVNSNTIELTGFMGFSLSEVTLTWDRVTKEN
jgi:uncharacterized protein (DUF2147 family)